MNCPTCGAQTSFIQQYNQWYCYQCQKYMQEPQQVQVQPQPAPAQGMQPQQAYPQQQVQYQQPAPLYAQGQPNLQQAMWYQNYYKIKRKVLAIGNKYWIEDYSGRQIGFSKQKLMALKDEIKIFTDENMNQELFRIKQTQIIDAWGTFAVTDSATNQVLGYVRRKALASMVRDEWEITTAQNQLIGGIYESGGSAVLRRFVSNSIPESLSITLQGQKIADINQKFKMIGDQWELNCINVPLGADRRVLISCLLLMGMIEHK